MRVEALRIIYADFAASYNPVHMAQKIDVRYKAYAARFRYLRTIISYTSQVCLRRIRCSLRDNFWWLRPRMQAHVV